MSQLHDAIENGEVKMVESLIELGCDINEVHTQSGSTPIYIACKLGHRDIANILINCGCKVNEGASDGSTPLYIASQNNHIEIVELLIESGCDVNQATAEEGCTPLYIAAMNGNVMVTEILISASCDIEAATSDRGRTALWIASYHGHMEIVDLLIKAGCDVNKATMSDDYVARGLVLLGTSSAMGETSTTPVFAASDQNHLGIVGMLIKAGCDVNIASSDTGRTPLYRAAELGHYDIVDLLIRSGSDINTAEFKKGGTPLFAAASEGHVEIADLLINSGCDIDEAETYQGWTPLSVAAFKGHVEVVDLLIEAGCDLNKPTTRLQETPLFQASARGHADVVDSLVEAGCDMNKGSVHSDTPLYIALMTGHLDVVNILMQSDYDVQKGTLYTYGTLISAAAKWGWAEIVGKLVKSGCDVNVIRDNGQTNLHTAVERFEIAQIHILVDVKADIHKKNDKGKSSLQLAQSIPDASIRRSVLAALYRRPPPAHIMSEDDWYMTSTFNGRDMLRLMREESLCDPANKEFSFRKMKTVTGEDKTLMQRAYHMASMPRGHAVIVNIMNYQGAPERRRDGSEVDVERLERLFTQLGFSVECFEDYTKDMLMQKVEAERTHDHKDCDAFVFIIMGHGEAGGRLRLSDQSSVDLTEDIVSKFDGRNCPNLRGKPKIFLFQACRGSDMNDPVPAPTPVDRYEQVDAAEYVPHHWSQAHEVHQKADILRIFSTYDGYPAHRRGEGSWFIDEFVFVCELLAHQFHILDLITDANRLLRNRKTYSAASVQTAQFDSSLRKPLYFFPGYKGSRFWQKVWDDGKRTCVVS